MPYVLVECCVGEVIPRSLTLIRNLIYIVDASMLCTVFLTSDLLEASSVDFECVLKKLIELKARKTNFQ